MTLTEKICRRCLHAKLRAADSVTCWNPLNLWHGATLSAFDTCEHFSPKVVRVDGCDQAAGTERTDRP